MNPFRHLVCEACWCERFPFRWFVAVRGDDVGPCCRCGRDTGAGIYVRGIGLPCAGKGPIHEGKPSPTNDQS